MFISKGNGKCIFFFFEHVLLSFAPSDHREFYWISLLTRLYLHDILLLVLRLLCLFFFPLSRFSFLFSRSFLSSTFHPLHPLIPTPTHLLSYVLSFLLHTRLFTPSLLSPIYLLPFLHHTFLFPPPPLLLSYLLLFFFWFSLTSRYLTSYLFSYKFSFTLSLYSYLQPHLFISHPSAFRFLPFPSSHSSFYPSFAFLPHTFPFSHSLFSLCFLTSYISPFTFSYSSCPFCFLNSYRSSFKFSSSTDSLFFNSYLSSFSFSYSTPHFSFLTFLRSPSRILPPRFSLLQLTFPFLCPLILPSPFAFLLPLSTPTSASNLLFLQCHWA